MKEEERLRELLNKVIADPDFVDELSEEDAEKVIDMLFDLVKEKIERIRARLKEMEENHCDTAHSSLEKTVTFSFPELRESKETGKKILEYKHHYTS